ncbi:hypothetical protein JCM8547_008173 [Rhodosporidiobolus lusitaniae]
MEGVKTKGVGPNGGYVGDVQFCVPARQGLARLARGTPPSSPGLSSGRNLPQNTSTASTASSRKPSPAELASPSTQATPAPAQLSSSRSSSSNPHDLQELEARPARLKRDKEIDDLEQKIMALKKRKAQGSRDGVEGERKKRKFEEERVQDEDEEPVKVLSGKERKKVARKFAKGKAPEISLVDSDDE